MRHLLDMRAGTKFNEDYADLDAEVRVFEQVYLWRPRTDDSLPDDACTYMAGLENDRPHGGPFDYRSILTSMLGWVVERAGGARLSELIAREVWQPIGAEFDAEITVDAPRHRDGRRRPLRDPSRSRPVWRICGSSRGVWMASGSCPRIGFPTRSPAAPTAARRSCLRATFPSSRKRSIATSGGCSTASGRGTAALGINGQKIWIDGPSQTVVVKLSTYPTALDDARDRLTFAAAAAIAAALDD